MFSQARARAFVDRGVDQNTRAREEISFNSLFLLVGREGSNLQPDGYEPSGRNGPVVTQIDTQALPRGEAKLPNLLIGLVAEEGLEPPTRGL